MSKLIITVLVLMMTIVTSAQDVTSFIELLRSDLSQQKKIIITEVMSFNEDESKIFWNVYREYEYKLNKVGDSRVAIIMDYAENYANMTDKKASEIMDRAFKFQEDRLKLKKDLWEKLKEKISPSKAAKFIQLENQIQLISDLQLNAELPLIEENAVEVEKK